MESTDTTENKYSEFIKLQLFDEKYLSRDMEKRMLSEGVTRFEISLEDARSTLMAVAAELDLIFERDVERLIKEIMQAFAATDGYIGYSEFQHAIHIYKQLSSGYVGEGDAKRRLKQIMNENDWRPRRQGLTILNTIGTRKWFNDIPS